MGAGREARPFFFDAGLRGIRGETSTKEAMSTQDLELQATRGDLRAQVRLAAELDAVGRHTDSITWLSRAAKAGDAEALTRVGMRLLFGLNAPFRPVDGAGLLSDATARGSGEAAAMISVLAGGGIHGPQSWKVALDYLQRSADLGWRPAQEQLGVLAGDPIGPGEVRPWGSLRESIDLDTWTRAPAIETLSESPRVFAILGLAPPAACDWVMAQARPRLVRALVHDPQTGLTIMGETRTNRVANFGLAETSLVNLLIQAKFTAATGIPLAMMEAFAVLHYGVGEQASEHFDFLDPAIPAYAAEIAELGQRVATSLLYLNDGYEGGETAFPKLGLSHRGSKGDALVFYSTGADGVPDPTTVHAGRPPTSGEKWVLTQFIRNKRVIDAG